MRLQNDGVQQQRSHASAGFLQVVGKALVPVNGPTSSASSAKLAGKTSCHCCLSWKYRHTL
jgi:hypothetical protein